MRTKQFIFDLAVGMAPAFLLVILPMHVALWLLSPLYTVVAWALIAMVAWQIARRRYHADERIAAWRATRHASHGVGR
jgi:hypothetical protein